MARILPGYLGDVPADPMQPRLEGRCIVRTLDLDQDRRVPQRLYAVGLDLGWAALRETLLEAVARGDSSLCRFEIADESVDEGIRADVDPGLRERAAAGEALFQQTPESARLGNGDSDAGHHHAPQQQLPFLRREIRFVGHGRYSSTHACSAQFPFVSRFRRSQCIAVC